MDEFIGKLINKNKYTSGLRTISNQLGICFLNFQTVYSLPGERQRNLGLILPPIFPSALTSWDVAQSVWLILGIHEKVVTYDSM